MIFLLCLAMVDPFCDIVSDVVGDVEIPAVVDLVPQEVQGSLVKTGSATGTCLAAGTDEADANTCQKGFASAHGRRFAPLKKLSRGRR